MDFVKRTTSWTISNRYISVIMRGYCREIKNLASLLYTLYKVHSGCGLYRIVPLEGAMTTCNCFYMHNSGSTGVNILNNGISNI